MMEVWRCNVPWLMRSPHPDARHGLVASKYLNVFQRLWGLFTAVQMTLIEMRCISSLLPMETQIPKASVFKYFSALLYVWPLPSASRSGLWCPKEQKAHTMGGHPGNGHCCGLCGTGGLRYPEEQAEERVHPQETGGVPHRSRHVISVCL